MCGTHSQVHHFILVLGRNCENVRHGDTVRCHKVTGLKEGLFSVSGAVFCGKEELGLFLVSNLLHEQQHIE